MNPNNMQFMNNMNCNSLNNVCMMPNYNYNNMCMNMNNMNCMNTNSMNNMNNMNIYNSMNMNNMNNINIYNSMNMNNMNNMNMFNTNNLNNMNNMNNMNLNNMNVNNRSMSMDCLNLSMNMSMNMMINDEITLNIHLSETKTVNHQISSSKTIEELIQMIKDTYHINYLFKLKKQGKKPLINLMTIAENGLENNDTVFVHCLDENEQKNLQTNTIQNNNLNNAHSLKKIEYSFSRYKKASKVGLKNLGDTSYLNSVLQLLGCTRQLSSYFVNPNNEKYFDDNKEKIPLTYAIHKFFEKLYPYPEKTFPEKYSPENILQTLGKINDYYKTESRKSPNILIEYFLRHIHLEMNKNNDNKLENNMQQINSTNKEQEIKLGLKNFVKKNNSIISNLFIWLRLESFHCTSCNNTFYHINDYPILKLDIEGAFKKVNSPLTITKCLEYQSFKRENYLCQNCQSNSFTDINSIIYSSPNLFVFSINREIDEQHNLLDIPFIVEKNVNINQFLENKNSPYNYELQGIVSITKNVSNKYVCFGKSPVDNHWYFYNDENVGSINEKDIFNNNQVYIPCILLYKSCK